VTDPLARMLEWRHPVRARPDIGLQARGSASFVANRLPPRRRDAPATDAAFGSWCLVSGDPSDA